MIKTVIQSNEASEGFIWFLCPVHISQSTTKASQDRKSMELRRNLEVGTEAEAIDGWAFDLFLMACSACFLIAPRSTSLVVAQPTVAGSSHVNHQCNKCYTDLPRGQSGGGTFSIGLPSSKMALAGVKLT